MTEMDAAARQGQWLQGTRAWGDLSAPATYWCPPPRTPRQGNVVVPSRTARLSRGSVLLEFSTLLTDTQLRLLDADC